MKEEKTKEEEGERQEEKRETFGKRGKATQ